MYNSGYHGTEQKTSAFWTAGLLLAARAGCDVAGSRREAFGAFGSSNFGSSRNYQKPFKS